MFADESDFDVIRNCINTDEYEPLMIPIDQMCEYEVLILKTGGIVITDDNEIQFNDDFTPPPHWDNDQYELTDEDNKLSRDNSNCTIYTTHIDTKNIQCGQISNIPLNVMVCTLVLKNNLNEINDEDFDDVFHFIKKKQNKI
jgi:hypothetical protein